MKFYIVTLFLLSACSSSNQHRQPAVEKEICFDYSENTIICNTGDKCYLSNIMGTYSKNISCKEFDKKNPLKKD